jgi:hypothetical protein
MVRIIAKNADCFMHLFNNRIFRPKEKMAKDERNFFEILIYHSEPEVRSMAS